MYAPATLRDIFFASLLSIVITFFVAVTYAFYPLLSAMVSGLVGSYIGTGSSGIGAVAGGVSGSFVRAVLVAEPVIFLIIFALLRRRRMLS